MKKFFIFLFAVFLITFMGCQTGFGGNPEMPTSETTEETTGKTTVETNGEETTPETFEVFAFDNNGNILRENGIEIGTERINELFNLPEDGSNFVYRYFYERIKINNTLYTVKSNIGDNLSVTYNRDYHRYGFSETFSPLDFKDFCNGTPAFFQGDNTRKIIFSDLYEEVK